MRSIGQISDARRARAFSDFLVGQGIPNELESESGSWSVWIRDDDHIPAAQSWFAQFSANPDAEQFRDASTKAAKVRQDEAQSLEQYRKRIRTRRSIFPKFGGYGIGFLTYALMAGCAIVFVYSNMGDTRSPEHLDFLRRLFITDPDGAAASRSLPEVFSGEVWRLFTPIFIHFGLTHFFFNMLWLLQLGGMIEGRQGIGHLAFIVAVTALISNLAQYYVTGWPAFGGMSGVVYGLAGYVWIRGRFDRESGLYLHPQTVTILLVWLVICFTPVIGFLVGGGVANAAHVAGLLVGMGWGWISSRFKSKKVE
jgi:GlpG protein